MNKNLLIGLVFLFIIGVLILKFQNSLSLYQWGHHFSFENEMGIKIDSLTISVGDVKTNVLADTDSLRTLEANINVPKDGYPHNVTLIIFSEGKSLLLEADPFNCYNCDGSHQYKLTKSGAEYKFLN